jgi:putative redox protein
MTKETVNTRWLSNMAFEADVDGHKIVIDTEPNGGGEYRGPTP